jgi:hypothetical protein
MRSITFWSCIALALAGVQSIASAQEPRLKGAWNTDVTIKDCHTGAALRDIRGLNLFVHDGSFTETAASLTPARTRSSSVGTWHHLQGNTFTSTFEFFRYNPDGSLFSTVKVKRTIELSADGNQFTSIGTVEDFDSNGVRISVSCPTEMAVRVE